MLRTELSGEKVSLWLLPSNSFSAGVLKNSSRLRLQEAGLLLVQWPVLVVLLGACR